MENAKESISNILSLLQERGYEIKVEKKKTGGYDAHFNHKIAVNPSCKYSYSSEWTEQEIKHDLVYKLLSWSDYYKNSSWLLRTCIGFWIILDRENIEYNGNWVLFSIVF